MRDHEPPSFSSDDDTEPEIDGPIPDERIPYTFTEQGALLTDLAANVNGLAPVTFLPRVLEPEPAA